MSTVLQKFYGCNIPISGSFGKKFVVNPIKQRMITIAKIKIVFRILFRYKYTYMEEMLGNIAGCRQVFERWMEWEPEEQAWLSYIKMELRYKEVDRARAIYEAFVMCHPNIKNWIRFARFEENHGNIG